MAIRIDARTALDVTPSGRSRTSNSPLERRVAQRARRHADDAPWRTVGRVDYEAYPEIQGLYYPSSLTNRPAVALYERADRPGRFPANPVFHRALSDPTLHKTLVMVGEEVGYGLV